MFSRSGRIAAAFFGRLRTSIDTVHRDVVRQWVAPTARCLSGLRSCKRPFAIARLSDNQAPSTLASEAPAASCGLCAICGRPACLVGGHLPNRSTTGGGGTTREGTNRIALGVAIKHCGRILRSAALREPIRIDAPAFIMASRLPVFLSSVSSISWLPCRRTGTGKRFACGDAVARRWETIKCRVLCASASLRGSIGTDATLGRQECPPSSFAWKARSVFHSPAHLFSPLLSRRVHRARRGVANSPAENARPLR